MRGGAMMVVKLWLLGNRGVVKMGEIEIMAR